MLIGRDKEVGLIDDLHTSSRFEFLILYGRRRVGKTALLREFARTHSTIFYSAQAKNDALNLKAFSETIQRHYSEPLFGAFSDWSAAFTYLTNRIREERVTLIIDEFPYIAEQNPSITSILQHLIDHTWKEKNLFLILCGSSISFMEKEVLGEKSPLYGRATNILELKGFDYLESSLFVPDYSVEEKILTYGILGGIPCYLETFRDSRTITQNIEQQILRMGAFLRYETQNLLKMELREPAVYNSIFEAIATGSSRLNDIAQKIHEEPTKCSKYMKTLIEMRLIEKHIPCGEKESSRKSIYRISDNFFLFWYRYLFPNASYYELLGEADAATEISEHLSVHMGWIFEKVCTEYLIRKAKRRELPFIPHSIGRWWGNNPHTKKEDDIDILALNKDSSSAIFCECKFRNRLFAMDEYRDFLQASQIITKPVHRFYLIFSRSGFTESVEEQASRDGVILVHLQDLFDE